MLRQFVMTCYFRHLQHVFKTAGIEVTRENKREIDRVIHDIVGVEYKNCPAAWREVKKRIAEDEEGFISKLKKALTKLAQGLVEGMRAQEIKDLLFAFSPPANDVETKIHIVELRLRHRWFLN